MKRFIAIIVATMVFLMTFAAHPVAAEDSGFDGSAISETPESPDGIEQYTDAREDAKLFYDNGRVVLRYRDTTVSPRFKDAVGNWLRLSIYNNLENAILLQTWVSDGGTEYVDIYMFEYGSPHEDGYTSLTEGTSGKLGFYGDCFHLQFRYSSGELIQTAYKVYDRRWNFVIDSYVIDTEKFCLYSKTVSGFVVLNGKKYYDNSPMPYEFKYKTTFRMLTDGALTYNTYFYDVCYKGGDDVIKVLASKNQTNDSGRLVVVESVRLFDGSSKLEELNNPAIMCQISTYGTSYDIVSTNDDGLLSLLGISKPPEKYWDVAAQEWKNVSGGSGGGGIGGLPPIDFGDKPVTDVVNPDNSSPFVDSTTIPLVTGLTVSEMGVDAWLKYTDYENNFGNSLMHKSTSPTDAADAWGFGHKLTWNLGTDPDGHALKLQVVARVTVQLKDGTEKSHFIIMQDYDGKHPGNNTKYSINAASGEMTVALYDLILALTNQVKSYATAPPAKFFSVKYYLTPFYKDGESYYRGAYTATEKAVNKVFAAPPVDDSLLFPEPDTDGVLEGIGAFFKNIASMLTAIPSFLVDLISTFGEMIAKVGEVPLLLGTLFTFLPAEVITIIRLGVLACVVIGIIRWMRG